MPDFTSLQLPVWAIVLLMVLAWASREGIGAILAYRKARMAEQDADDQKNLAGWTALIGELKARVAAMEEALAAQQKRHDETTKTLRDEHIACLKSQAESAAKIASLEDEVKGLRQWRHDVADAANEAVLKAEVEKRKSEMKSP